MHDAPKLKEKIKDIRRQLDRLEGYIDGKKQSYESDSVFESDHIFSEAMYLARQGGELVQNMATAWRKELKSAARSKSKGE
jgi:hypothetical protein